MGSDYLRLCKGEERLTPRPWVVHEAVEREKPGVWSASHIHIPRPQLEAETAETVALCLLCQHHRSAPPMLQSEGSSEGGSRPPAIVLLRHWPSRCCTRGAAQCRPPAHREGGRR